MFGKLSKLAAVGLLVFTGHRGIREMENIKRELRSFDHPAYSEEATFTNSRGTPITVLLYYLPTYVYMDSNMSEFTIEEVKRAISTLSENAEALDFIIVDNIEDIPFYANKIEISNNVPEQFENRDISRTGGSADYTLYPSYGALGRNHSIFLNPTYEKITYYITLHELLHTLGFKHVEFESIMKLEYDHNIKTLTELDIEMINTVYPNISIQEQMEFIKEQIAEKYRDFKENFKR